MQLLYGFFPGDYLLEEKEQFIEYVPCWLFSKELLKA